MAAAVAYGLKGRPTDSPTARADPSGERPYPILDSWPPALRRFLKVETSRPVFNVLYHYGHAAAAPSGAYGPNVTAPRSAWLLEYQRAGGVDVIAGVLHRDDGLIEEGLRMFHFGLARQARNGSFPGSATPFHGTAMFLAEAAPALLVLKYSPLGPKYEAEVRWQVPRLRLAARHLVRVVGGVGRIDDRTKNHRFYEAALALSSTGVLAADRTLQDWAVRYAHEAIAMQRPNGVMPEDGGHDTGYQALGLVDASRYLFLAPSGRLFRALYQALRLGETWERSRIRSDGAINQSGDTRSYGCRERDATGTCKTAFYATIFNALARWSVIANDSRYERAAYMVWLQNWARLPGDVLPRPGLWVTPASTRHGQWLTVWGTRFFPLEVVHVYFDTTLEQTIVADQIGSFGAHSPSPNAYFALPDVPPGTHTITVRGSLGTVRRKRVTVTA